MGQRLAAHTRGRGRFLPAVGHSDAHRDPDVVGLPQTVVLADDLSREAILFGIRAGRAYLAESSALTLTFTATGPKAEHATIGGRLPVHDSAQVTVRLHVTGAPPRQHSPPPHRPGPALHHTPPRVRHDHLAHDPANATYVRAEVRRAATTAGVPGPMAAMTNPIFLGRD